jgi:hypothetical protein
MNPQQMLAQIDQEIEKNLPGLGFWQVLGLQRFSVRLSDVREVDLTPQSPSPNSEAEANGLSRGEVNLK